MHTSYRVHSKTWDRLDL